MSKKKKNKLLIALLMGGTLATGMAAVTACEDNKIVQIADSYTGIYYLDAPDGKSYQVSVSSSSFMYSIDNTVKTAAYELNENVLKLNFGSEGDEFPVQATFGDTSLILTFHDEVTLELYKKVEFSVMFDLMDGGAPSETKVLNGQKAAKPQDPTRQGYKFRGWYADSECTEPFDFDATTITKQTTVYAKWLTVFETEYTVTLDPNYDDAEATKLETIGGKLPDDYTAPAREGYQFGGWWTSEYGDGQKLSYLYDESQGFTANITLYARWIKAVEGNQLIAPTVSFDASTGTLSWAAQSGARGGYQVVVLGPDGTEVVNETVTNTRYTFADYANAPAGDYVFSVTALASSESNNSEAGTIYLKHNCLDQVTGFEVEGTMLFFEPVEHAEKYIISIRCGNEEHNHATIDNGASTYYNFANCSMPREGIVFTVSAVADGYATSVTQFSYSRSLDGVEGLVYDSATQTISWNAVSYATNYFVTIGGQTYNTGSQTSFDLKKYPIGEIEISVSAYSKGYYAPDASEITVNKTQLAAPDGIKVTTFMRTVTETNDSGVEVDREVQTTEISWNAVTGAEGYRITLNGKTYTVTDGTKFDITDLIADWQEGNGYELTIVAYNGTASQTSLASDAMDIRYLAMGASLSYEENTVSWSPVAGAYQYGLRVNGGNEVLVKDGSTSAKVALTKAGYNKIEVRYYSDDTNDASTASGWASIEVYAYSVTVYENNPDAAKTVSYSQYYAYGDRLALPTVTRTGYTFSSWYNLPGGSADNGNEYTDLFFLEKGDIVLYAGWVAREISFTLDPAYEDVEVDGDAAQTVTYGSSDFTLPVIKTQSAKWQFLGWYTQQGGAGKRVADSNGNAVGAWDIGTNNAKLYAYCLEIYDFKLNSDDNSYTITKGADIGRMASIVLPSEHLGKPVTMVAANAFKGVTSLQKVWIPDTITMMFFEKSNHSFYGCTNLVYFGTYHVDSVVTPTFTSEDGVLIQRDLTTGEYTLAFFPPKKTGNYDSEGVMTTEYRIPDMVNIIPSGTFRGIASTSRTFTKVTVPASVKSIGGVKYSSGTSIDTYGAFYSCTALKEVVFEGGGTDPLTIGSMAFASCSKLESITFPARLQTFELNKNTGDFDAFTSCSLLAEVNVLQEEGVTAIYTSIDGVLCSDYGKTLFFFPLSKVDANAETENTINYTVPTGITKIAKEAFRARTKLTGVTIPNTVTTIEKNAFYGCTKITYVTFEGNRGSDITIAESAFSGCTGIKTVTFAKSTFGGVILEQNAFYGCTAIESLDWEEGNIKTIGEKAFYNAKLISTLVIPESVTSIGAYAFQNCAAISTLTFKNSDDPLATLTLEAFAFNNCALIKSVVLPNTVGEDFTASAFNGCPVTITVDPSSEKLVSTAEGIIYNKTQTKLIYYPSTVTISELILPENLEEIGGAVFSGNMRLTSVVIPASVKTIGENAFYQCENLKTVTFTETKEGEEAVPLTIGLSAFSYVPVTGINLPERLTEIGRRAFERAGLTSVVIPKNVTKIGDYAFYYCPLTDVSFQDGGTEDLVIGSVGNFATTATSTTSTARQGYTFAYTNITSIHLPARVTVLGNYTFSYASALTEVVFDDLANSRLEKIGTYAFNQCKLLTSLTIPAGRLTNSEYAIDLSRNDLSIKEYEPKFAVADTLGIGRYAFYSCTSLETLTFTEANAPVVETEEERPVYTIGDYAFSSCSSLKTLTLSSNLTTAKIDNNEEVDEFGAIAASKTSGTTTVDPTRYQVFNGCTSLTAINVVEREGAKFASKDGILYEREIITDENGNVTAGELTTLVNCPLGKTGDIVIPNTVTKVSSRAFYGRAGITSVTFEANEVNADGAVTKGGDSIMIGDYYTPTSAAKVELKSTTRAVFDHCTLLKSVTFPSGKEITIGDTAFYYCQNLINLNLPTEKGKDEKPVRIGAYAFYYCSNLGAAAEGDTSETAGLLNLPSVKEISNNAFYYSTGFTKVDLGYQLEALGNYAFAYTRATEFVIPETLQTLGKQNESSYVFAYNKLLQKISFRTVYTDEEFADEEFMDGKELIVANYVFSNCTNLQSVSFPRTLKALGTYVFNGCSKVNSVTFADGCLLSTIGDYAFRGTAITSIVLPDELTTVSASAFTGCDLVSITIPSKLTTVSAFASLSTLQEFVTKDDNKNFIAVEGVLYSRKSGENGTLLAERGDILYAYPSGKTTDDGVFTVPDGVTQIGAYAFSYNSSLKKVVVPASVTSVGNYAFSFCSLLEGVEFREGDAEHTLTLGNFVFSESNAIESFTVPSFVKEMGTNLFTKCTALQTVTLNSVNVSGTTKTLPAGTFKGCSALTSVTLPEGVTVIDTEAFYNCTALESFTLPSTLKTIGNYAFYYTSAFTTVTVPENVTSVGQYAFSYTGASEVYFNSTAATFKLEVRVFQNAPSLKKVVFAADNKLTKLPNYTFYNCPTLESVAFPAALTEITNATSTASPFWKCYGLKTITFGDETHASKLKTVGNYAFYYCTSLESFTFPSSVTTTGTYVFSYCSSLSSVTLSTNASYKSIGNNMFYYCTSLETLAIPANVTTIGTAVFAYSGLTEITIPKTVVTITAATTTSTGLFSNCKSLKNVVFEEGGKAFNLAYMFYNTTALETVTLPSTLTGVGKYAFQNSGIPTVTIPNTVTTISEYAFNKAIGLKTIVFAAGSTLKEIGYASFYGCTALKEISLPASLTTLKAYGTTTTYSIFGACKALEKVTFEGTNLTAIPQYAFYQCASLDNIVIPSSVTSIGYAAFRECTSLSSIKIPASVTALTAYSETSTGTTYGIFYKCTGLKTVEFEDGTTLETIPQFLFYGCSSLEAITIPASVKTIGFGAFAECDSLLEATIPATVETIKETTSASTASSKYGLFEGCDLLKKVTFAEGCKLESVPNYMFNDCVSLEEVVLRDGINSFGKYSFANTGLASIALPATLETIGDYAFYGAMAMKSFTVPASVTSIGMQALATMETIETAPNGAFVAVDNILYDANKAVVYATSTLVAGDIVLETTVETIESYAFANRAITSIVLPEALTTIGNYAFDGCDQLETVTVSNGLQSIGTYAFRNCLALQTFEFPTTLASLGNYAFAGSGIRSVNIPDTMTSIGTYAFQNCADLAQLTFDSRTGGITIGTYAFSGSGVQNVELPEGLTTLSTGLFSGSQITSVTIPASVMTITSGTSTSGAFANCPNLASVKFASNSAMTTIGNYAFYNCPSLKTVELPQKLTGLGSYLFWNDELLDTIGIAGTTIVPGKVELPVGLVSIDAYAFYGTGITSITLNEGMTELRQYTFANCTKLVEVNLPSTLVISNGYTYSDQYGTVYAPNHAFMNTAIETITLPDNARYICIAMFKGCKNLKSVVLGQNSNLTTIYYGAFSGCEQLEFEIPATVTGLLADNVEFGPFAGVKKVTLSADNETYHMKDGMIFNAAETIVYYCDPATEGVVTLPETVTTLYQSAFEGCSLITDVVINDGLKLIYSNAFKDCASLTKVDLSKNTLWTAGSTYKQIFMGCTSLQEVVLPESATAIAPSMFEGCTSLTSVNVPAKVTTLGVQAFKDCTSLKTLDLSESGITTVSAGAFAGCTSLREVVFNEKITTIGATTAGSLGAFEGCRSLKRVVLPDTVKTIYANQFKGCTSAAIIIPVSATALKANVFDGWTAGQTIYVRGSQAELEELWDEAWKENCNANVVWEYTGTLPELGEEEPNTPYIGEDGNWWIGDENTGIKAYYIGENGNWWIGDQDTGIKAE